MASPFLGQIMTVPYNFAPRGWAFCNGQLLSVAQFPRVYAVLGTTYGGDGRSSFALPNLQGSMPLMAGQGPGLSNRPLGVAGGVQNVTLGTGQMALHSHRARANAGNGTVDVPGNAVWATSPFQRAEEALYSTTHNDTMSAKALAVTGGLPDGSTQPHNNMMPYLPLSFIIALEGVAPQAP